MKYKNFINEEPKSEIELELKRLSDSKRFVQRKRMRRIDFVILLYLGQPIKDYDYDLKPVKSVTMIARHLQLAQKKDLFCSRYLRTDYMEREDKHYYALAKVYLYRATEMGMINFKEDNKREGLLDRYKHNKIRKF